MNVTTDDLAVGLRRDDLGHPAHDHGEFPLLMVTDTIDLRMPKGHYDYQHPNVVVLKSIRSILV